MYKYICIQSRKLKGFYLVWDVGSLSNLSVHVYDEEEIDETIVLIRDSFLPAFDVFLDVLEKAEKEEQDEGWT